MKKSRHGFGGKDDDLGSERDLGILSREEDLDDEIIDLDDIVELGLEEEDDEEKLRSKEEILDAEGDLDLSDLDAELDEREDDLLEEDLLKELSFDEEIGSQNDARGGSGLSKDQNDDFTKGLAFEKEDAEALEIEDDLDLFMKEEEKDDFEKFLDMEIPTPADSKPRVEEKPPEVGVHEVPAAVFMEKTLEKGDSPEASGVDEFLEQIETRLVQTVREIVEARLPEIVRALLREEIENLKKDLS